MTGIYSINGVGLIEGTGIREHIVSNIRMKKRREITGNGKRLSISKEYLYNILPPARSSLMNLLKLHHKLGTSMQISESREDILTANTIGPYYKI